MDGLISVLESKLRTRSRFGKGHSRPNSLVILTLLSLSFLMFVTEATASLGVSPKLKEIRLSRGGWNEYQLTVTNHTDEPIVVGIFVENMDISEDGIPTFADEGYQRGCADWITFTPEEFGLEPDKSMKVQVRIKAPGDALGSYFANLICRPVEARDGSFYQTEKSSMGISIQLAVISLLLVTVSSSRNQATIEPDTIMLDPGSMEFVGPLSLTAKSEASGWKIEVPVYNSGNIYTQVGGEVSVYTESGGLFERASLEGGQGYLFPERRRIFTATGQRPLPNGAYLVRAHLSSREGKFTGGSVAFTVVDGQAYAGTDSEELYALLRASMPGFSLSERFIAVDLIPNSSRIKGVTVANHSPGLLALIPRLLSLTFKGEGDFAFSSGADPNSGRSCASWVSVSPDTLLLQPGAKRTTKIKVQAPDSMDGEYYAALRFDTRDSPGDSLPPEFQMPSTLFIAASDKRNLKPSGAISAFIEKQVSRQSCLFEVKFENTGNAHCFAAGKLEVLDKLRNRIGQSVDFGSDQTFIFPGMTRTYLVSWNEELEPGDYQAMVAIVFDQTTKALRESIRFQVE